MDLEREDSLRLQQEMAPQIVHSIENGDLNTVMLALDMSFDPNFPITNTKMALYSLLCGMKPECINITQNGPQIYV